MANWENVGKIQGEKGEQGERGERGLQGDKGDKGDKGDPFRFADFTPQQLEQLSNVVEHNFDTSTIEVGLYIKFSNGFGIVIKRQYDDSADFEYGIGTNNVPYPNGISFDGLIVGGGTISSSFGSTRTALMKDTPQIYGGNSSWNVVIDLSEHSVENSNLNRRQYWALGIYV